MSQLNMSLELEGDVAIVSFSGEFDYAELQAAQDEIRVEEQRAPSVVLLDLTGLDFMDSSAVRVILEAASRAREEDRRLALIVGTGPPHRVLSILGLTERLDIVPDRASVLHRLPELPR
ncbi:MAG: STAS domain-containing protein [Pseudonocardiaceae bacterium]